MLGEEWKLIGGHRFWHSPEHDLRTYIPDNKKVKWSKKDTNLLPDRLIALWPYSKMNDSRIYFGDKYIALKQDENKKEAFKIGILNREGWAAYFNNNNIFIKKFTNYEDEKYPDFGVSYETYTNEFMTEMESLSPLTTLNPNSALNHVESWKLIKEVSFPGYDEEKLDSILNDKVNL